MFDSICHTDVLFRCVIQMVCASDVAPDDVLQLTNVTKNFLCSPKANVFGIDFTRFKIRDMDSGTVLFEIAKPPQVKEGRKKRRKEGREEGRK
jgi:hypothetical protein